MKFALASLALFAFAGAANAQDVVEISYFPNDLLSPARVELLEREIVRAAERICDADRARTLGERLAARECVREVAGEALSELEVRVADARTDGGRIFVAAAQ